MEHLPAGSMRVIETKVYSRQIVTLLDEEEQQELMDALIGNPAAGDVIQGSGGCRKIRWSGSGRGKRGGTRVIYFWKKDQLLYLLLAYAKNVKDDLSKADLKQLKLLAQKELPNE